jgi:hypothetical protein
MKVKFSVLTFAVLLFPVHSWGQNAAATTPAFGSNTPSFGIEGKFRYYITETYLNPSVFTAPAFRAGIRMATLRAKALRNIPRNGGRALRRSGAITATPSHNA